MICKIGEFLFEARDTDTLRHELSFDWTERKRLGNAPLRQATGKWDEEIALEGRLMVRSVKALDEFEELARSKKPVRLTLGTGESYMVVITTISKSKKRFHNDGYFIEHDFSIALKRYFE